MRAWHHTLGVLMAAAALMFLSACGGSGDDGTRTTLAVGIGANDTTIVLANGLGFPNQGIIQIDKEQISYTKRTDNTLTGILRGVEGTTKAAHGANAEVRLRSSVASGTPVSPTNTRVPPTATRTGTNTPVSPTATATTVVVPPTATPTTPEGTPPDTPTNTPVTPVVDTPTATPTTPSVEAECGNNVVEGNEECDDGKVCKGGTNHGAPCVNSGECPGDEETESPECATTGGDGCAVNCTNEDRRLCVFQDEGLCVGGDNDGGPCAPGTAVEDCPNGLCNFTGASVQTGLFVVGLTFGGQQVYTTGKARPDASGGVSFDGVIPAVIRKEDFEFEPVKVPGLVCACVRGEEVREFGPDLAASGSFGCGDEGLENVDVFYTIDHVTNDVDPNCENGELEDGTAEMPHGGVCNGLPVITVSGQGPKGSISVSTNTSISLISDGGTCAPDGEGDPSRPQGADGIPCTDDDTILADPTNVFTVTGTASASVDTTFAGSVIGEGEFCGFEECRSSVTGLVLDCSQLEANPTGGVAGSSIVAAFGALDSATIGDNVTLPSFACKK